MTQAVWFRKDLRIHDHPALLAACNGEQPALAVYVNTPTQNKLHQQSLIQREFELRNLAELNQQLAGLGIALHIVEAEDFAQLPAQLALWCEQHRISELHAHHQLGVNEQACDAAVAALPGLTLHLHHGDCVMPHGSVLNQSGSMFKVYTPFSKAWLNQLQVSGYHCLAAPATQAEPIAAPQYALLQVEPQLSKAWLAGEAAAQQQLQRFCIEQLADYEHWRDFPALQATSNISAYLALGVLSPGQCLQCIEEQLGSLPMSKGEQGFSWLNELIWREFYRHLLHHFPKLSKHRAFKDDTDKIQWPGNREHFEAWCDGNTGFPIIDAAMRCLAQTGWMHNRLRMIVASFLTKDLHIDWRWGEGYFMTQLIDGDLAANNGGWQWAASTGADAAPYFRIFNPTSQSERFDPKGQFIRRWVPELSEVPDKQIHAPLQWLEQNGAAGTYPPPIVDHKQARLQALALYKAS